MGIEDLKHDDIEKKFEEIDEKEKEKRSLDSLKKAGVEISSKAKEISPEANENGAIDMVKNKYDITTKNIEDKFLTGEITEDERNKQMQVAVDEFTKDIETIVGTQEGSEAKQNRDFGESKQKETQDYANKLEKFNKELSVRREEINAKKRIEQSKKFSEIENHENKVYNIGLVFGKGEK